jgi:RES domain-containing protein
MSGSAAFPGLSAIKGVPVSTALCRMVERSVLERPPKSDFLFTSGRPGRYNSRGIQALYAAEDLATAGAESERYRKGRTTQTIVYWATPNAVVVDLGDAGTIAALGLVDLDLFAPWMFAATPTRAQLLGEAVAAQTRLGGIRFPSDAARTRGFVGYNFVFYKAAVAAPSSVVIHDDSGHEIQRWP